MEPASWSRLAPRITALALPGALTLIWLATAAAGRLVTPALATQIGALVISIPLTCWAIYRAHLDRRDSRLLMYLVAPVAVLLVAATLSDHPRTALIGGPPLWQGWLMWAVICGWLVICVIGADRADVVRVTRALCWLGTLAGLWVIAELAGLIPTYDPTRGAAMALFDNPSSLGQALTVTLACTASLLSRPSNIERTPRWLLWSMLALQVVALLGSESRAAMLGITVAVAAYGLTRPRTAPWSGPVRVLSASWLAALLIGVLCVSAAWSGLFGPRAFQAADHLLTGRLATWDAAMGRLSLAGPMGLGPTTFDSVTSWGALPDGRLDFYIDFDAHSILFTWLLGSGVAGLVAFGFAAIVVARRLTSVARSARAAAPVRWLLAAAPAAFVSMLTSWPDPLAVLGITLVVGCVLGASNRGWEYAETERTHHPIRLVTPAALVTAGALMFAWTLLPHMRADIRVAEAQSAEEIVQSLIAAAAQTHDPYYLEAELAVINGEGGAAMTDADALALVRGLAKRYPPEALHRVDIPLLAQEILWTRRSLLSNAEYWRLSRFYANRGLAADPSLAVWKYTLARAAASAHRPEAERLAERALQAPHPSSADALLSKWASVGDVERRRPPAVRPADPTER